eukprot:5168432-Lingulodinium_polyedra.AAC.1
MPKTMKKMVQSWADLGELDRIDQEVDALSRVLSVSDEAVKSPLFSTAAKGSVRKVTAQEFHFLARTALAYILWA